LGEFDLALKDLNTLHDLIERIDPKEKEADESFYSRLLIKSKLKQFAIYAVTSQYNSALDTIEFILGQIKPGILDEKTLKKINQDKDLITNRIQCEEIKNEADACVNRGEYEQAKKLYLNIVGVGETSADNNRINQVRIQNPNERILSNLSLIAINSKDYESAIFYCTECLKILKSFKEKISINNSKKFENFLEVKILLRRAESYVALNEMTKAQDDLEAVERYEIRNQEILEKFNFFKEKLKNSLLENYEKKANSLLKSKEFTEALEYYNRSISLIKKKEKIEQVKFYLNRCSCLIALGQFEKVEEECNRLISNLLTIQNIAIIKSDFSKLKNVKDLLFNTYVKRAYANTKSNKVEEAIRDYKSAIEINANDVNVKKNLAALEKIKAI
jgi:tetratricopeptide (TPR) repeat protein